VLTLRLSVVCDKQIERHERHEAYSFRHETGRGLVDRTRGKLRQPGEQKASGR
jgi:hypothetical protein